MPRHPPKRRKKVDRTEETRALRSGVAPRFLALFDHLLNLAKDDQASGMDYRARRAGQYLRKARLLATDLRYHGTP